MQLILKFLKELFTLVDVSKRRLEEPTNREFILKKFQNGVTRSPGETYGNSWENTGKNCRS